MAYTFGELRKLVAPFVGRAGKCETSQETAKFARSVMELLLLEGSESAVMRLNIMAYKGCVTLPPEVDTPLKVNINYRPSEVWSKWGEFRSAGPECSQWPVAGKILAEDGQLSPLAYDLPDWGGSYIAFKAMMPETTKISVQGFDTTRKQIFTFDNQGNKVAGQTVDLKYGEAIRTTILFGEVTGIVKEVTNGYVTVWAVNSLTDKLQFIGDISPSETKPSYRRFKLLAPGCEKVTALSILCRVKLRDTYLDNELTLFSNTPAIVSAARRLQFEENNNFEAASYARQATQDFLDKEANYKRISGKPVDVFHPLSGNNIPNILSKYRTIRRYFR